jgi:hypothetical protein
LAHCFDALFAKELYSLLASLEAASPGYGMRLGGEGFREHNQDGE